MNHSRPPDGDHTEPGAASSDPHQQLTAYDLADLVVDYTPEEIYGPNPTAEAVDDFLLVDDTAWADLPWHTLAAGEKDRRQPDRSTVPVGHRQHRIAPRGRPGARAESRHTRGRRPGRSPRTPRLAAGNADLPPHGPITHTHPLAVALLALAIVVACLVGVVLVRSDRITGQPAGRMTTASPTPQRLTPTATLTPRKSLSGPFVDCSQLGAGAYCIVEPECWATIRSYADAPSLADRVRCDEPHLYQTFVVGWLDVNPRRQASLDAIPLVQKLCRTEVVNRMLVDKGEVRSDWEIFALPPQERRETYFRCVVGRSVRSSPLELR